MSRGCCLRGSLHVTTFLVECVLFTRWQYGSITGSACLDMIVGGVPDNDRDTTRIDMTIGGVPDNN